MIGELFNTFHDGSIEDIKGAVPGDLLVAISIEYIRERFEPPGETFDVTLEGCQRFDYCKYESDDLISDLEAIASIRPGILSAEANGDTCTVFTECGKIFIEAKRVVVQIDGGKPVSLEKIRDATNEGSRSRKPE